MSAFVHRRWVEPPHERGEHAGERHVDAEFLGARERPFEHRLHLQRALAHKLHAGRGNVLLGGAHEAHGAFAGFLGRAVWPRSQDFNVTSNQLYWDALACMVLGMALYKTGVLPGARRPGTLDFSASPTWPDLAAAFPNGRDVYCPT